MTTITIDKELLEQVVNKLLTCWPKSDPLVNELRAALAAPATAPAQPAWHDAPTVPGLWACRQFITDRVQAYEVTDEVAFNKNLGLKGRWYGPIPPDGDKP